MQSTAPSEQLSILQHLLKFIAKHQQTLKWLVYALLVLNFGYYLFDDWRAGQSTLLPDATFLEIASNYATSLDEVAWFMVLFLLEVETYWMEDDERGFKYWLMQSVRVLCYLVICHTLYAFIGVVMDLGDATLLTDVKSVCALVGQDLSFTRNLLYEAIEATNCASLSNGGALYLFEGEPVVSDVAGYSMAINHAWIDVIEVSGWLSISLLITFIVQVQERGIYNSPWIKNANRMQYFVYAAITGTAIYWAAYEFYVYTWDILLWMGGFAAIDANLVEWRDELEDEDVSNPELEVTSENV